MVSVRVLAARIGCDNTGDIWVADGTGSLEKRRWHSGAVPAYPAIVKRTRSLMDLADISVSAAINKYRFPYYLRDDMRGEATLSITRALKNMSRYSEQYLIVAGIRGCVDAFRYEVGRTKNGEEPSDKLKAVKRPHSLNKVVVPTSKDGGEELELIDTIASDGPGPGDAIEFVDEVKTMMAKIPVARHREVALRTANGETEAEIGRAMGVSESRISQILSQVRKRLEEPGEVDRWAQELIPVARTNSLTVSWR